MLGRGVPCDDPFADLMPTLRNTYLTGRRTARRRPRATELSEALPSPRAWPDVALEQRETLVAIAALSDDRRRAVVAIDIMGLSYREAAHALGTCEATITTRLFRARADARRMSEDGVRDDRAPSSGAGALRGRPDRDRPRVHG